MVTAIGFKSMTSKYKRRWYSDSCWVVHPKSGELVCKIQAFKEAVYGVASQQCS